MASAGPRRPGVLPAGTIPDPGDRSGPDRGTALCGLPVSDPAVCTLVTASSPTPLTTSMPHAPRRLIPTYNERENLPGWCASVLAHAGFRVHGRRRRLAGRHRRRSPTRWPWSSPGRVEVMHRTGRTRPRPLLHRRPAARARRDRADFICQMDADLRTIRSTCRRIVDGAARGHDLVIGSRYLNGGVSVVNWPLHRIILSTFAQPLHPRRDQPAAPRDCTSGYRCWRREALAQLPLDADGLRRLRVPRRDALRGAPAQLPHRRGADHLRRAPLGQSKLSANVMFESSDAVALAPAIAPAAARRDMRTASS